MDKKKKCQGIPSRKKEKIGRPQRRAERETPEAPNGLPPSHHRCSNTFSAKLRHGVALPDRSRSTSNERRRAGGHHHKSLSSHGHWWTCTTQCDHSDRTRPRENSHQLPRMMRRRWLPLWWVSIHAANKCLPTPKFVGNFCGSPCNFCVERIGHTWRLMRCEILPQSHPELNEVEEYSKVGGCMDCSWHTVMWSWTRLPIVRAVKVS